MTLDNFIAKLSADVDTIEFSDTMNIIDSLYTFSPTSFSNGDLVNEAGQNNGSCKIFAFGKLNNLSKQQTLVCFGAYYRDDVLKNPKGDDHQNIRNFIISGWDGVQFDGQVLI